MNKKYEFKISECNGFNYIEMIFEESKYDTLSGLLNSNIVDFSYKERWMALLNLIIDGKSEREALFTEAHSIFIEKDNTIVEYDFSDDRSHIETKDFIKILDIWFNKLEEFNKYGIVKKLK